MPAIIHRLASAVFSALPAFGGHVLDGGNGRERLDTAERIPSAHPAHRHEMVDLGHDGSSTHAPSQWSLTTTRSMPGMVSEARFIEAVVSKHVRTAYNLPNITVVRTTDIYGRSGATPPGREVGKW